MMPTVSAVIPSWNGRQALSRCVPSILDQTSPPTEVIVVDNGSDDGTASWLAHAHPSVRMVRLPVNRGFAGGVNAGIAQATGVVVWIVNNDAVCARDCLAQLLERMADDETMAVCSGKVLRAGDCAGGGPPRYDAVMDVLSWTGFLAHVGYGEEDRGQYDHLREVFSPKGVCFAIRRAAFEAVGRFDEAYFCYCEESDLFWRLWLAGYRVGFAPAAVVWHEGGATTRQLPSAMIDYHAFKNRLAMLLTNLGGLRLCVTLPLHAGLCGGIALAYAATGRGANAAAIAKAYGTTGRSLGVILRKRRWVQRGLRRVSDRALFQRHQWPLSWRERLAFARVYLRRW